MLRFLWYADREKERGRCAVQCVYDDDRLPDGFEEHVQFSAQMPYTVRIKHFRTEDIVPLHYAETLEVLLCDGLCGEIVIDTKRFPLGGQQLFVIPPYTVHANTVHPGDGTMYVFKVCLREMERYFSAENLLAIRGASLDGLQYACPAYAAAKEIVCRLMAHDGDLTDCLSTVVDLFALLSHYADHERSGQPAHPRALGLQQLIRWTNENCARKITIEEVAAMTGYSKYHFCSRFKAQTGMTYMHYLNSVRISRACLLLKSGDAVQTVCRSCGFENTSHFIQAFKKIQGMTPRQYAAEQRAL